MTNNQYTKEELKRIAASLRTAHFNPASGRGDRKKRNRKIIR